VSRRDLFWDGCVNVRDLGGLPTEDGGITRFGAIVRADSIRHLSDAGWEALRAYGVERIVDLRWHDELAADPPRELDVEVSHVPVFPDVGDPAWRAAEAGGDRGREYAWLLETGAERFAQAVTAVAAGDGGAVVVHCAAGKDRTGLVVALVLRLAAVPHEAIVEDYVTSGRNLAPFIEPWIDDAADGAERERRTYLSLTPPGAIEHAVREVERRHGSVETYLRSGGASGETLARIRRRLVG
jgi:protein tyrosine/serine phosphatase